MIYNFIVSQYECMKKYKKMSPKFYDCFVLKDQTTFYLVERLYNEEVLFDFNEF